MTNATDKTLAQVRALCIDRGYNPKCHGNDVLAWLKQRLEPIEGICSGCGCTDDYACDDGCSWANENCTLCTNCVPEL